MSLLENAQMVNLKNLVQFDIRVQIFVVDIFDPIRQFLFVVIFQNERFLFSSFFYRGPLQIQSLYRNLSLG